MKTGLPEFRGSRTAEEFRLTASEFVRKSFRQRTFWTRRKFLSRALLTPFAFGLPLGPWSIRHGAFRVRHSRIGFRLLGPAGEWGIDSDQFVRPPSIHIAEADKRIRIEVRNADLRSADLALNFNAQLSLESGELQLWLRDYGLRGSVDFDDFCRGAPLDLYGVASLELSTSGESIVLLSTNGKFQLTRDWQILADSAHLTLAALSRPVLAAKVKVSVPAVYRADLSTARVELLTSGFSFHGSERGHLSLTERLRLTGLRGGSSLHVTLPARGPLKKADVTAHLDYAQLVVGPETRESEVQGDLEQSVLQIRTGGAHGSTANLRGFLAYSGGRVFVDGVATNLRPNPVDHTIEVATLNDRIATFEFHGLHAGDYADVAGFVGDSDLPYERPLSVELAAANRPRGTTSRESFVLDPETARVTERTAPLRLHLRRREDKVDIWAELYNLRFRFDFAGLLPASLKKVDEAKAAEVLFVFPAQHVSENSRVVDTTSAGSATPIIARTKLAPSASEPSRAAFRIPESLLPLKCDVANMLRFDHFEPFVDKDKALSSAVYEKQERLPWFTTVVNLFRMSLVPVRFEAQDPSQQKPPSLRWSLPAVSPTVGASNELFHARLVDRDLVDPSTSSGVGLAVAEVNENEDGAWEWPMKPQPCGRQDRYIRPLSARDRYQLRVLTFLTKFAVMVNGRKTEIARRTLPLLGRAVVLSSQGGFFRFEGNWEPQLQMSLVRYLHTIVQGRDVEVTIVREYFLYPYGHRFLLIKLTMRRTVPAIRKADSNATHAAELQTEFRLLAKDESMSYGPPVQPFPWRKVAIPPDFWLSPPLDFDDTDPYCRADEYCPKEPVPRSDGQHWAHQAFWPIVGGKRFEYPVIATDYAGATQTFKRSYIFLEHAADDAKCDPSGLPRQLPSGNCGSIRHFLYCRFLDCRETFNGTDKEPEGFIDLHNQTTALALSAKTGDTDFQLSRSKLTAKYKEVLAQGGVLAEGEHPSPFIPAAHWVEGRFTKTSLPNADHSKDLRLFVADPDEGIVHHPELPGGAWRIDSQPSFEVTQVAAPGLPNEHKEKLKQRSIFAVIDARLGTPSGEVKTTYSGNTAISGAVVSPDINIGAASRAFGATAYPTLWNDSMEIETATLGTGSISEFFPLNAKLCGVELLKIVAPLFQGSGLPPAFTSVYQEISDGADSISANLNWTLSGTEIQPFPGKDSHPFFCPALLKKNQKFQDNYDCKLTLSASTRIWVLGQYPPQINIGARITDFTVHIGWGKGDGFNGIAVPIKSANFNSRNGEKPKFSITLADVFFVGPALEFIDQLQQKLKELQQSQSGWRIGFESTGIVIDAPPLVLPDLTLGAFDVINLAIYSGLTIPFFGGGGISFHFSLAKSDAPFRITAGIYAGGGYALLELDTVRVRKFEMSLEFGAAKSLRYGPVSGDVGAMGGVKYIATNEADDESGGYKTPQTKVSIEASVRAFGTFSAWNLISLFLELYVGMKAGANRQVAGTARFTISTEVAFVSYSYTASHRERLAGKGNGGMVPAAFRSYLTANQLGGKDSESTIHTKVPSISEKEISELLEAYA